MLNLEALTVFVYSNKIYAYIKKIKLAIREILTNEIKVKVSGDRFFDSHQTNSYPISAVIYNDSRKLGYFDSRVFLLKRFDTQKPHRI